MYSQRRERLPWASWGVDALLVAALPNIRYLTGFTGSNALLLLRPDSALLFTDPRYTEQAAQETGMRVVIATRKPLAHHVTGELAKWKPARIGFERARISWNLWTAIHQGLPLKAELVPLDNPVEALRMVKDESEIAAIRHAVTVNSAAFDRALRRWKPDMTELDLAAELDYQMRRLGASEPAFETIVASGPRTALPHARPTAQKILKNQLLLIDMGATVDGYASDMTRTVAIGSCPPALKQTYRSTLAAQQAAIAAVRPGVTAASVDRAARQRLKADGLDRQFVHSTGHGLGLEIHEPPRLAIREATRLVAGMAITIEPGVYQPGVGGIRIEDTVLVTDQGVEVLTPTPKELLVLG